MPSIKNQSPFAIYLYIIVGALIALAILITSFLCLVAVAQRRAARRAIAEAIANGVDPSELDRNGNRIIPVPDPDEAETRPSFYDVHLDFKGSHIDPEGHSWNMVMPLSLCSVIEPALPEPPATSPQLTFMRVLRAIGLHLFRGSEESLDISEADGAPNPARNASQTHIPLSNLLSRTTLNPAHAGTNDYDHTQPIHVNVGVIIAMPSRISPHHATASSSEQDTHNAKGAEKELPHLEFGVAYTSIVDDTIQDEASRPGTPTRVVGKLRMSESESAG